MLKVDGIDVILLDNMDCPRMVEAVAMRNSAGRKGKVDLEASGGVTIETVRSIALTGVERIAVGAITHSAPALDNQPGSRITVTRVGTGDPAVFNAHPARAGRPWPPTDQLSPVTRASCPVRAMPAGGDAHVCVRVSPVNCRVPAGRGCLGACAGAPG